MLQSTEKALIEVRRRIQQLFETPLPPRFGSRRRWMIAERLHAEGVLETGRWPISCSRAALTWRATCARAARFGIRRASFRPLSATSSRVSSRIGKRAKRRSSCGSSKGGPLDQSPLRRDPESTARYFWPSNRLQSPSRLSSISILSRFFRKNPSASAFSWQTMRAISS